ncbi:hypothetical protein TWF281_001553 [Arthrobotrys megalospora]
MRFSVAVTFLAALAEVAFGQNSCGATAASCPTVRNNAASRSSCSSYFTYSSIKTSTCYTSTVITTKYNSTRTLINTLYSTARATVTSTSRVTTILGANTVTYRPTTTATATATAYNTIVSISTVRSTVTSFSTSTAWRTITVTRTGSPPSTLAKLRKRQAVTVPPACSCFLFTSTVRTRAANEFPSGTTTVTISTTSVTTSTSVVPVTTTVSIRGGIVTATLWVTSTATVTQTLQTTVVSKVTTIITQPATTVVTSLRTEYTYVPSDTPDISCPDNTGLEVALYDNPYRIPSGSTADGYLAFNPAYFKTSQPYTTNRTSNVGLRAVDGALDDTLYPYGMAAKVINYPGGTIGSEYALNHRGYFYAPKSETYTFKISKADDGAWIWIGQKAYTTWTRQNADAYSVQENGAQRVGTAQATLAAGTYMPIRIMLGNGLRVATFEFEITDSTGKVYASTGSNSNYLVAFACDRPQDAPPFNPFGTETSQATGPPDASCGNAGMELGIYDDPFANDPTENYASFKPEAFRESIRPYGAKIVNAIGLIWAEDGVNQEGRYPYGFSPPQNPLQYTLNWRGYLYAPKSATYYFKLAKGDNFAGIWTGDNARRGWARSNVDITSIWYSGGYTEGQFSLVLAGGTYLPLRVILGNWGGAGSMDIDIWDEFGTYYVRTSTASPYLVHYACDRTVSNYPDPFGEEP